MTKFADAREAKEFLVARIVQQADREGVTLSEVERKMLYFSETAWTLPDSLEVNEAFDRDYDQNQYKKKIATLIGNARRRAQSDDAAESDDWAAAVKKLGQEDHYLSIMIKLADTVVRPRGDLLKLWGTGFAISVVILVYAVFSSSHC